MNAFDGAAVEEVEFDRVIAPCDETSQLVVDALDGAWMRGIERVSAIDLRQRLAVRIAQQQIVVGVFTGGAFHGLGEVVAPIRKRRVVDAGFLALRMHVFGYGYQLAFFEGIPACIPVYVDSIT